MHTEPRGHNGRYSDQVMLMVTLVLSVCVLAACGGPSHSASNPQSRSTGTTAERRVSTAASQTVYVTMLGVQVVPIDVQTNRPQSPIYTTSAGLIAITSNGMTAYVGLGSQVTAIDLATKSVGTSITVPGNDLSALALSSDDKTLYVLSGDVHQESAEFVAVNLLTDKVELSAAVPGDPEAVVISPSGTAAYLADNQDAAGNSSESQQFQSRNPNRDLWKSILTSHHDDPANDIRSRVGAQPSCRLRAHRTWRPTARTQTMPQRYIHRL